MMDGFSFRLAMADPLESETRFVYKQTGLRIRPLLTALSEICDAIARSYACAFEPYLVRQMTQTLRDGPYKS